jgi:hypothetical protein
MVETTDKMETTEPLYRHRKRSEWGLAILAWEQPTKRGYQFQDGMLRIISEDYYDLLCVVDDLPEGAAELIADLKSRAGLAGEKDQHKTRTKEGTLTFADQTRIFRIKYPQGFADPGWLSQIRGVASSRRLKRHRQPAIDEMRGSLTDEALQQALDDGRSTEVVESIIKTLAHTNLVKPKELNALEQLPSGQHADYVTALRDLLFGEAPMDERFDRFAAAQGKKGGWPVVTAPAALVQPESMVCVQPTMIRRQARVLEPALIVGTDPKGRIYERVLTMLNRVRDLLTEASLQPADLMDVFDLMGVTLLPSARQLLQGGS